MTLETNPTHLSKKIGCILALLSCTLLSTPALADTATVNGQIAEVATRTSSNSNSGTWTFGVHFDEDTPPDGFGNNWYYSGGQCSSNGIAELSASDRAALQKAQSDGRYVKLEYQTILLSMRCITGWTIF
jgi:hypothetical protein